MQASKGAIIVTTCICSSVHPASIRIVGNISKQPNIHTALSGAKGRVSPHGSLSNFNGDLPFCFINVADENPAGIIRDYIPYPFRPFHQCITARIIEKFIDTES